MEFENVCKLNLNCSSDLICRDFVYETANMQASPRRAQQHFFCLVTHGRGRLLCDDRSYDLAEGVLFVVESGCLFSVESVEELKYYYISFHGRRGDEYLERLRIGKNNCVFRGYGELIPFWYDCQTLAEDGNIDIVCEAVLLYSLAKLRPLPKEQNDVVSQIVTLTQNHFNNPDLSLSVIAEKVGYDAKYLSSLFKKRQAISYTQYLRELRIKHAIFLMEQGVVSVKNVSLLSGFRDALYFSKVFTAEIGVSPKAYIKQLEENKKHKEG